MGNRFYGKYRLETPDPVKTMLEQQRQKVADTEQFSPDYELTPEEEQLELALHIRGLNQVLNRGKKKEDWTWYPSRLTDMTEEEADRLCNEAMGRSFANRPETLTPLPEMKSDLPLSSGQPLPEHLRIFFENRYQYDFSGVKVHNTPHDHFIAERHNARALTHGTSIVFNQNEYQPGTHKGTQLIGHELAHTMQQSKMGRAVVQRKEKGSSLWPDYLALTDPEYYTKLATGKISDNSSSIQNDLDRIDVLSETAVRLVNSKNVTYDEKVMINLTMQRLNNAAQAWLHYADSLYNSIPKERRQEILASLPDYTPFAYILLRNMQKMSAQASQATPPGARSKGPLIAAGVMLTIMAAYSTNEAIQAYIKADQYKILDEYWVKVITETDTFNKVVTAVEQLEELRKKLKKKKGPYPIYWPHFSGKALPLRPQLGSKTYTIDIGKELMRAPIGAGSSRNMKIVRDFKEDNDVADDESVHHVVPIFLGGGLPYYADVSDNLIAWKNTYHDRGHKLLRYQPHLRNYGISPNLYSIEHVPGTKYVVFRIV